MPIIRPGEATEPSQIPDEPVYPIHPATGDIQQFLEWDVEAFHLWCPRYRYYILDIEGSRPDSLYGEPTDVETGGEVFINKDDPLMVYCYVHWESQSKQLQKVGVVTERDIVLEFSTQYLASLTSEVPPNGLSPKRGDVMIIDQTEYVIQEVSRGQPWYGNIQYPIHIFCPANRVKRSNLDDDRADTDYATGPEHPEYVGEEKPEEPPDLFDDDWE
jgi:hypothetical protein